VLQKFERGRREKVRTTHKGKKKNKRDDEKPVMSLDRTLIKRTLKSGYFFVE